MDQNESAPGTLAVHFADVEAAARRIAGKAVKTPLLSFPLLEKTLGFRLLVKAETLQLTGSFKFRGACNKLMLVREQNPSAKAVVADWLGDAEWRRVIPPMPDIAMIERQHIVADFRAWDAGLPEPWRSLAAAPPAGNVVDLKRA